MSLRMSFSQVLGVVLAQIDYAVMQPILLGSAELPMCTYQACALVDSHGIILMLSKPTASETSKTLQDALQFVDSVVGRRVDVIPEFAQEFLNDGVFEMSYSNLTNCTMWRLRPVEKWRPPATEYPHATLFRLLSVWP